MHKLIFLKLFLTKHKRIMGDKIWENSSKNSTLKKQIGAFVLSWSLYPSLVKVKKQLTG